MPCSLPEPDSPWAGPTIPPPISRADSRQIDHLAATRYATPTLLLIEHAALACQSVLLDLLDQRRRSDPTRRSRPRPDRILIFAGPGNNGADGLALARLLALRHDLHVLIALAADPADLAPDARLQYDMARARNVPFHPISAPLSEIDVAVDALLGVGLSRPILRDSNPFHAAIDAIALLRAAGADVLAIDVPTGLDADTGRPPSDPAGLPGAAVHADLTVSFIAPKLGFAHPYSRTYTGRVVVKPISIPTSLLRDLAPTSSPRPRT